MKDFMPEKYQGISEAELTRRIKEIKKELGPKLLVLTHHYQREEVEELGDFSGDSYGLSKRAAQDGRARYIVFCGVHFMAESAAVLARDDQAVFIPAKAAGCPMAAMARVEQVEDAWNQLTAVAGPEAATPVTYVNSVAAVKAFCGKNGGATCTSSNADKLFRWALGRRGKIFFLPDEHLGRNTAAKLGLAPVALWDPYQERGGLSEDEIKKARVIVWKGFCHVHTAFTVEQIREMRAAHPGCKVVVHPECRREVVEAADASGSTEGIIRYVSGQAAGSVIAVGTEINLVERLARKHAGTRTVLPLARSLCPNMYKINLNNLCWTLESIPRGPEGWVNRITIPPEVKRDAALALRRMLENAG
ncbi:MAG TPA: quinolinate synthase NadA [bacterium]|nr:quinolinate synthase NadA [bacterium]